jgi:hypothetical protein
MIKKGYFSCQLFFDGNWCFLLYELNYSAIQKETSTFVRLEVREGA